MEDVAPQNRKVPRTLGRYELLERIGAGGMAEVYLARSFGAEGLEKRLVIKTILPTYAQKQRFVTMFVDEARIAVTLNHPNIVQTYDFGSVDGTYFLAMEYVEGMDLAKILTKIHNQRAFPLGEALHLGIELCKGLDYAHRRKDPFGQPLNLVHCDISPHNVLISKEGDLKIVDFGIARARSVAKEADHIIKGKFAYMSPEQALGGPIDHRSDIFSTTAVIFELLYGRALYPSGNADETLNLVRSAIIPDLSTLEPQMPPAVEKLLNRGLDRIAARRYQNARELQLDLHRALLELGSIHDSQTVADFLLTVDATPLATVQSASVKTMVEGPNDHTPSLAASTAMSNVGDTPSSPVTIGDGAHTSELRRVKKDVICLAANISGFAELRAATNSERCLACFAEVQHIIDAIAYKYDAVIESSSENGFLLLLGLPVSSENDAEQAIHLAMDLTEAIAGINLNLESPLQIAIGIALGKALVTYLGTKGEYERQILGRNKELAQQMAREALSKEILVGGRIYQRTRHAFESVFLKRIPFLTEDNEGYRDPSLYRIQRPKSRKERQEELRQSYNALQGRELSLKALRRRFHQTQLQRLSLGITLEGPVGLGKSAIVDAFLKGLERAKNNEGEKSDEGWGDAVRVLRAMATQNATDTPYAVVRELVFDLVGLEPNDDLRSTQLRLERFVNDLFPNLEPHAKPYLCQALGFFFQIRSHDSVIDNLSGDQKRYRIFLALHRIFNQAALHAPLIVVIDNLQHCDDTSLAFLSECLSASQRRPIFIVCTARHLEDHSPALPLLNHPNMRRELIAPLDLFHADAILRDALDNTPIDANAAAYILDRAGGVPYFILEIIDTLRSRNALRLVEGRYVMGEAIHQSWLPASIEGIVAAHIDQLQPPLREALCRCAVIGLDFERQDAALLFGQNVIEQLEILANDDWLKRTYLRGDATRAYRFTHTLTYEVALREVPPDERMVYHRRLADHYIDQRIKGQPIPPSTIAKHLEGAQSFDEAARYYHEAATEARREMAPREALRMATSAANILAKRSPRGFDLIAPQEAFHYLEIKAWAYQELGEQKERFDTLQHLHRIAHQRLGMSHQLSVTAQMARYWYDTRKLDKALTAIDDLQRLAGTSPDGLRPIAEAKRLAAMVLRDMGSMEDALKALDEALAAYRSVPATQHGQPNNDIAWVLKTIGDTFWHMGRFGEAIDAYNDAVKEATEKDLIELITINTGLAHVSLGNYQAGLQRYLDAIKSCQASGGLRREAAILPNLGHLYALLGNLDEAEKVLRRGLKLARQIHNHVAEADAALSLAAAYLDAGHLREAERTLRRSVKLVQRTESSYLRIHQNLAMAQIKLARHDPNDALEALDLALSSIAEGESGDMDHGRSHGNHLASMAYEQLGRHEMARQHGQRAIEAIAGKPVAGRESILYEQSLQIRRIQPDMTPLAVAFLHRAAAIVHEQAQRIDDATLRASFIKRPLISSIINAIEESTTDP